MSSMAMSSLNVTKKTNFNATKSTGTTYNAAASEKYDKHESNHGWSEGLLLKFDFYLKWFFVCCVHVEDLDIHICELSYTNLCFSCCKILVCVILWVHCVAFPVISLKHNFYLIFHCFSNYVNNVVLLYVSLYRPTAVSAYWNRSIFRSSC